jgi:phenylpyruvate tautomerase PptA (4-oxalocrotonate tautomerase family)
MPFVNVKLVEGVFSEKHEIAKALTDVRAEFEGSEALHAVGWGAGVQECVGAG